MTADLISPRFLDRTKSGSNHGVITTFNQRSDLLNNKVGCNYLIFVFCPKQSSSLSRLLHWTVSFIFCLQKLDCALFLLFLLLLVPPFLFPLKPPFSLSFSLSPSLSRSLCHPLLSCLLSHLLSLIPSLTPVFLSSHTPFSLSLPPSLIPFSPLPLSSPILSCFLPLAPFSLSSPLSHILALHPALCPLR